MTLVARQKVASQPVAPVVDGLLGLLVLLLVTAPLLARALSSPAMGAAAPAVPELRLQIGRAGDYALDGRPLGNAALTVALRQAEARSPGLRLRIAAADESDPRALAGALAMAEQAGVRNIGSELH
jgi:biopolymer transport protein ExbD/biopolymer transport protein TolR